MSSGQHRFPAYVSLRNEGAEDTQDVQLLMRHSRDAHGRTARYA